jgi:predicted transposase YbfD/YdcC
MNYSTEESGQAAGLFFEIGSLYESLSQLVDRRARRGVRYPLVAVLVIVVLAKLSGEDEPRGIAEWAKLRSKTLAAALHLKRETMPHHTTYSRVLGQAVDVERFEAVVGEFFSRQQPAQAHLALDGKTLRGTIKTGESQGVHLLAAYSPQARVVLRQVEVDNKENEIVVAPQVLEQLDLSGVVVTGDALLTQRTLSAQIVQAGGDYVWTVKDNQPTLRADIERLFEPEVCGPGHSPLQTDFASASTLDKAHGRLEQRTLTTSSLLQGYSAWPHLAQVFKLERQVTSLSTGQHSSEIAYGVTSLSRTEASPARLLELVRRHWAIENEAHYPRDVTFHEDRCRLRTGRAAHVMATLNNLVLGLIRLRKFDFVPQARRFFNARLDEALNLVLSTP